MAEYAKLASDGAKAANIYAEGKFAKRGADFEAAQMREQATADKAESVQVAKHERKKAELLMSRGKALAASSGTDVSSSDIQNVMADLDARGEYNSLAALYKGFSSARTKLASANMREIEGKMAKKMAKRKAIATIVDSGASFGQGQGWWG